MIHFSATQRIDKKIIFAAAIQSQENELELLHKFPQPNANVNRLIVQVQDAITKLNSLSANAVTTSDSEGAVVVYHDEKDDLVHHALVLKMQVLPLKRRKNHFLDRRICFPRQKNRA